MTTEQKILDSLEDACGSMGFAVDAMTVAQRAAKSQGETLLLVVVRAETERVISTDVRLRRLAQAIKADLAAKKGRRLAQAIKADLAAKKGKK